MEPRYPPAATEGDTVAIVAPSNPTFEQALEIGQQRFEERFGLHVEIYDTARKGKSFLESHPEERAEDVMRAFEDPDVKAVVAAVGGDDQLRILDHLDADRLRSSPTRFFGISDNTNLHVYLSSLGFVSFYGGQLIPGVALDPELPEYTERYLRRALFEEEFGELTSARKWTDHYYHFEEGETRKWKPTPGWTWDVGETETVTGVSWGGCIEVLQWLMAADICIPTDIDGGVLLLETSEELPTAMDVRRVLMCMGERGLLAQFDGVLVGRPKTRHKEPRPEEVRTQYRADQREAILAQVRRYSPGATVVFDVDFGHTDPHAPIPVGAETVVDATERRIEFQ